MTKQLINTKKWEPDDFRLLVVMLLVVVYPVFVLSFFALYVFVILPVMVENHYDITQSMQEVHQDGWYHAYWLFVSLLWLLLCAIILPCFQKKNKGTMPVIGMEVKGSPEYPTKTHSVQPFVKIEETNEKKRFSVLTEKSQGSSASIQKAVCDEKADKESLEKSRESLAASGSLHKRNKLVESGEFLNEYIDTLEHKELNKLETECEVHIEKKNEESISDSTSSVNELENKGTHNIKANEDLSVDKEDATAEDSKKYREEADIESIVMKDQKDKNLEAVPLMATCAAGDTISENTEVDDLENSKIPVKERKARPTIDTSGAHEHYECSMPTPKSATSAKRESNMVFLFVNPDTVDTEEDVQVVHAGAVEKEEQ